MTKPKTTWYREHYEWRQNMTLKERWLYSALQNKKVRMQECIKLMPYIHLPDKCPILGTNLIYYDRRPKDWKTSVDAPKDWRQKPSLDQKVPGQGYTQDNIVVISMRVNRLKYDATIEELEALITWLKTHED